VHTAFTEGPWSQVLRALRAGDERIRPRAQDVGPIDRLAASTICRPATNAARFDRTTSCVTIVRRATIGARATRRAGLQGAPMRKSVRRLLVFASAGMLTVGGLVAAGPASAGSWGGTLSCPSSTVVKSNGYKGGTGPITLTAPGRSYTDSTTSTGFSLSLRGASSSGSWSVYGSGATSGYGSCG
jgi:hypothetical protein